MRGGTEVAFATQAGPVIFVSPDDGRTTWQTRGHPGGALAVADNPVEPVVATGGQDSCVRLHDHGSAAPRASIEVGGWASRLVWSPDGQTLGVAAGRQVSFYSARGDSIGQPHALPSTVSALRFHAPTQTWMAASYGVVTLLRPEVAEPIQQLHFRTSLLTVDLSADARFVASGTQDPLVHVWDLADETATVSLTGYRGKVMELRWSPVVPVLATASGASVVLWDFGGENPSRRPRELRVFEAHVGALDFTRDGMLLAGCDDGSLALVDLAPESAEPVRARWSGKPTRICAVVREPNADRFVVNHVAGHAELMTLETERSS